MTGKLLKHDRNDREATGRDSRPWLRLWVNTGRSCWQKKGLLALSPSGKLLGATQEAAVGKLHKNYHKITLQQIVFGSIAQVFRCWGCSACLVENLGLLSRASIFSHFVRYRRKQHGWKKCLRQQFRKPWMRFVCENLCWDFWPKPCQPTRSSQIYNPIKSSAIVDRSQIVHIDSRSIRVKLQIKHKSCRTRFDRYTLKFRSQFETRSTRDPRLIVHRTQIKH